MRNSVRGANIPSWEPEGPPIGDKDFHTVESQSLAKEVVFRRGRTCVKKLAVFEALMRTTSWEDELAYGAIMSPLSDR